ncbi:MAG TPA: hypothetical protein VMV26_14105 [Alphaproteobacteria bacterium]|nr:hypothetical protein [Alphaproteobacteria bacterium]
MNNLSSGAARLELFNAHLNRFECACQFRTVGRHQSKSETLKSKRGAQRRALRRKSGTKGLNGHHVFESARGNAIIENTRVTHVIVEICKYRELSREEQQRAAALVKDELKANATVIGELEQNANTFLRVSENLAGIVRDKRFVILNA